MGFVSLSPRQEQCLPKVPFAVYRGLLCSRVVLEGKTALHLERLNFRRDFGEIKRDLPERLRRGENPVTVGIRKFR